MLKALGMAAIVMIVGTGPAAAQSGGHIGLYSDAEGNCCVLNEVMYVPNNVYVVHSDASGARAVQFKVDNRWVGAIVGEVTYGQTFFGDIFTGVIVAYPECEPLPHLVATMSFTPMTPTPPESVVLFVDPDPAVVSGQIEVADCALNVLPATGGVLNLNSGDNIPMGCMGCIPTPAEESTWGRLKALYR